MPGLHPFPNEVPSRSFGSCANCDEMQEKTAGVKCRRKLLAHRLPLRVVRDVAA